MSEFDNLLASFTEKGGAKVHGAIMKCVDKNGTFPSRYQTSYSLTYFGRKNDLLQDLWL